MTELNATEKSAIAGFTDRTPLEATGDSTTDAAIYALRACLEAGRLIRPARLTFSADQSHRKSDGSPATLLEHEVEIMCKELLAGVLPDAKFVGEETGGTWSSSGIVASLDPIDGTWAFLSGTETFSTALTVFQDGQPIVGAIASPVTGEIGYATESGEARLLQLGQFGTEADAASLPLAIDGESTPLVNLHPSPSGWKAAQVLHEAWLKGELRVVRSPGGSPSWALLEAARGNFTYVNLWSKAPAEPWDLAAGCLIVRRAGGEIIDLHGEPIDALSHSGPFIASISTASRDQVRSELRTVLQTEP